MKNQGTPRKRRRAPQAFLNKAYERSDEALHKIEEGKASVNRDLKNGNLLATLVCLEKTELTQRAFLEGCGLHYNFLNGHKHKGDTKAGVEDFLERTNRELRRQLGEAPDVDGGGSPSLELSQLRARYERLKQEHDQVQDYLNRVLTRVHQWQIDLRQAHRVIRELKASAGLSVVHLRRR
ncbi:hypothetical protein ELG69_16240 [Rhizobium leguminosarum]|uniref:hypothetical protein n=1 Tax=Rhizobium leguminosarum TaxID=384 RepID=UPI001031312A|nr:hypothetical protein [Rhizobium leguminosarum]TBG85540.1 hypothetical protein ELG69_16240 [Rhizobium leguminosarum]